MILGEIVLDDEGRIYLDIAGDKLLMSNTLIFYLISEMSLYEKAEKHKEFKEKYKEVIMALQTGKSENLKIRQELNIDDH